MKFERSKRLVFLNNKWGVGKTTLAFNCAVSFAQKWYKTVLLDLDPQCNLSRLSLWPSFEKSLLVQNTANIYGVLKWIIEWGSDIDLNVPFQELRENLLLLPGDLRLSGYQDLLISAYNQAAWGQEIGYFQTSALSRYMLEKWLSDEVDIFVIDASPSLDLLNRIVLLSSDYFVAPLMPDAFSLQWIENLWKTLENWKTDWRNTGKALARWVASEKVLGGEWLFLGYVINSYNQYNQGVIRTHQEWMELIPESVKKFLSEKHCRNGLVEKSWTESLADIKDYWQLPSDAQMVEKALCELIEGKDFDSVKGTVDNFDIACEQFEQLSQKILELLHEY